MDNAIIRMGIIGRRMMRMFVIYRMILLTLNTFEAKLLLVVMMRKGGHDQRGYDQNYNQQYIALPFFHVTNLRKRKCNQIAKYHFLQNIIR